LREGGGRQQQAWNPAIKMSEDESEYFKHFNTRNAQMSLPNIFKKGFLHPSPPKIPDHTIL
jgi:hypothetical protein